MRWNNQLFNASSCLPSSSVFLGECINSSVAGKRRIAEWGALHTVASERIAPGVSSVALTVFAAAAAVFLAVLFVLQVGVNYDL